MKKLIYLLILLLTLIFVSCDSLVVTDYPYNYEYIEIRPYYRPMHPYYPPRPCPPPMPRRR